MNEPRYYWFKISSRYVVLLALMCLVGCGGGLSQEDMMRMGIRRKKDPEPVTETAQASSPVQPAVSPKPSPPKSNNTANRASQTPATSEPGQADQSAPLVEATSHPAVASDRRYPSEQALPLQQRLHLTAGNLERIGQALEAYRQKEGIYPPRAIYDNSGTPLLSWRVLLLPYLGYGDLYSQFQLDKPWNHPANKELLEKIPAVFQSPERFDSRSNYLLAVGRTTVFPGPRTIHQRRIEDGLEHTLLLLEVDDAQATSWTKPEEYEFSIKQPWFGLGSLRQGRVFVLWGGGMPGAVSSKLSAAQFSAMFTIDGGEAFSSYSASKPLDEEFFATYESNVNTAPDSSSNQGQSAAVATASATTSSAAVAAPNASSALATSYLQAAELSAANHLPADALLWYYASNTVQQAGAGWHAAYRWVPALRRPSPTIHFCIGVLGEEHQNRRPQRSTRRGLNREREEVRQQIGDVGMNLVEIIEVESAKLLPAALASASSANLDLDHDQRIGTRKNGQQEEFLPVTHLGIGSRSEMIRESRAKAGDILVLFEVGSARAGNQRELTCNWIDLVRSKEIISLPPVRWLEGTTSLADLEQDEAFRKARWQLKDAFEDTLVFEEWPTALKPRHAQARVSYLSQSKSVNPVVALAEMCVYRNRQLIDNKQLLDGFRAMLGEEDGETLMLGSDKKRKRILRNWLPAEDFEELQQQAADWRGRRESRPNFSSRR